MNIAPSSRPVTDSGLETPLYQQVYLLIRERIMSGEYPDRSLLPSEHEAAELFGVSRITAKRALNEVAAAGLCVRKRGQGSRVTYKPAGGPLTSDVQGLLDVFTEGEVLEFDYGPAGSRIGELLEIPENDQVQRSVRARRRDGKPFSYLTTYVPADLGRSYDREHLVWQSPLKLLEKSGVKVANARQTITASLADAARAEALEVKPGSALLRISRLVRDRDGRAVEYIVGLYRPDQFQYGMSLERVGNTSRPFWTAG